MIITMIILMLLLLIILFNTDTNTHTHSHRHSNSNNKANDPRAARQINWDRVPANGDRRLLRSSIYVS